MGFNDFLNQLDISIVHGVQRVDKATAGSIQPWAVSVSTYAWTKGHPIHLLVGGLGHPSEKYESQLGW